jgi:hypothetical protein
MNSSGYYGGIVGMFTNGGSSIQACYNTGKVSGNGSDNTGAICGQFYGAKPLLSCYWLAVTGGVTKDVGFVRSGTPGTALKFASGSWPTNDPSKNWGEGNDPENGYYWKPLGSYSTTEYPKLYWEE